LILFLILNDFNIKGLQQIGDACFLISGDLNQMVLLGLLHELASMGALEWKDIAAYV